MLVSPSMLAGSLVWIGYRGQSAGAATASWREEWGEEKPCLILLAGFAGSRFFVAFGRDTLPKQVSLLAG